MERHFEKVLSLVWLLLFRPLRFQMMLYLLLFIVFLNKEVQQVWGLLFCFISVLKLALAENQPSTQA